MTAGERIAVALKKNGMNQADLASSAKIAQAYVSQIVNDVRIPSDRLFGSIAKILKVNFTWLKTGEGPMEAEPTLEEALARLSADVLADEPDSFRARLVDVLVDLSLDEWRLLEGIASKLAKKRRPSLTLGLRFAR